MSALAPGVAWLFCPADRPDRYVKAAGVADVVVIDLEDAVTADRKVQARMDLAARARSLDPSRTVVRVNPSGTEDQERDLALLSKLEFRTVMLAKAESAAQIRQMSGLDVVALCETARGVLRAEEISGTTNCVGLMWGAEDLIADLGGFSSRDERGRYRHVALHARSRVLLSAAFSAVPALDAVYLNIKDLDGLAEEATDAVESGFQAKVCLHPSQVPVVRKAFAPSDEKRDWATRVLAAAAASDGRGALTVDGRMVDEVVLRQARRLLDLAQR